jgi:hypothetical protein
MPRRQPLAKGISSRSSSSSTLEESLAMLCQDINSSYSSICAARGAQPPLSQQGRLPAAAAAAVAFTPTASSAVAIGPKALSPATAVCQARTLATCIQQQQHSRYEGFSLSSSTSPEQGNWLCSSLACSRQPAAALALPQSWSHPVGAAGSAALGRFRSPAVLQQQFQAAIGQLSAQTCSAKVRHPIEVSVLA